MFIDYEGEMVLMMGTHMPAESLVLYADIGFSDLCLRCVVSLCISFMLYDIL